MVTKKNEDNDGRITRDELEKRMGIGKATLKKVINKNNRSKKPLH